jgi:hypothetical protein
MQIGRNQRALALLQSGRQCQEVTQGQRCQTRSCLQVHHLTYARLGEESEGDLVVLCEYHHRIRHRIS